MVLVFSVCFYNDSWMLSGILSNVDLFALRLYNGISFVFRVRRSAVMSENTYFAFLIFLFGLELQALMLAFKCLYRAPHGTVAFVKLHHSSLSLDWHIKHKHDSFLSRKRKEKKSSHILFLFRERKYHRKLTFTWGKRRQKYWLFPKNQTSRCCMYMYMDALSLFLSICMRAQVLFMFRGR